MMRIFERVSSAVRPWRNLNFIYVYTCTCWCGVKQLRIQTSRLACYKNDGIVKSYVAVVSNCHSYLPALRPYVKKATPKGMLSGHSILGLSTVTQTSAFPASSETVTSFIPIIAANCIEKKREL